MKISFAVYDTSLCGGVRAIFEVANNLSDRGYKVGITALGGNHEWFKRSVPVNYVRIPKQIDTFFKLCGLLKRGRKWICYYLALEGMGRRLGIYVDFARLAIALPDYDINIATWYPTAFAVWFSGKGRPYYLMQDFPELVTEVRGKHGLRMFEASLRLPLYFLTNSNYTKNIVLSVQPGAKVRVVGVGINTSSFHPIHGRIIEGCNKNVIMAILRGLKFKGDDIAIKVMNLVNKRIPIHAILLGSRDSLGKAIANTKPQFTYTHFESVSDGELAKLYSSSDLFLFTSYAEGFGLPPLEAMACGTPVVTTDCKGNRDYAVDGYNALVAPPGDVEALANAAMRALTEDKLTEELTMGGLETARKWSWGKVVDEMEKAFNESQSP